MGGMARTQGKHRHQAVEKGDRQTKARWRWLTRLLGVLAVFTVGLPVTVTLLYRVIPPPITPLMVIRLFEGNGLDKRWTPLERVSSAAAQAVIAAEDNRFCQHSGIDWQAIKQALDAHWSGDRLRGASTISMQVAKNIFLWPKRSLLRKALEIYLTLLIEAFWSKRRILEVYLNVAEWGPGVYGVEAAARRYFNKPAAKLTGREAALLAVLLPNPQQWSPRSAFVRHRAQVIRARIGQIQSLYDCL